MASPSKETVFIGDVSPDLQERIIKFGDTIVPAGSYNSNIMNRMFVKEVEVYKRPEDDKTHVKTTYEIVVTPGTSSFSTREKHAHP